MIFKQLFQKSYLHKLPEKRLAAIPALDPKVDGDKRALHELAFNDESDKVTLAALHQLNLFTLWLKAYETHFHSKVREHAKAVVITLIESEQAVPDILFLELVQQAKYSQLTQDLIFNSRRLQQHNKACIDALFRHCQEHEIKRFYQTLANDAQRRQIIESTGDEKQLKRYKKLDNSVEVNSQIIEKLQTLEEAASKPPKVIAAGKLINAKLLALSDSNDYLYISEQKQALMSEFEVLKGEFQHLSQDEASSISQKYFAVKEKIDKRLTLLEPDYRKQVHLNGISDIISDIEQRAHTLSQQVNLLAESDDDTQLVSQIELLSSASADLELEIKDIDSAHTNATHHLQIKNISRALKQNADILLKLPFTIEANAKADALIVQALAALEDKETEGADTEQALINFDEVKSAFNALKKTGLSQARLQQWQTIEKQRKQHKIALVAGSKLAEKRCMAKLGVCQRMIEQGKYKNAMAVFRTSQKMYADIERPSTTIQKRFAEINDKVGELKDWQSYIAAPRKPELITLAEALAKDGATDIAQRAALVKQYRQEFNSLGKLHTAEDDALNKDFDDAIEQAFAPCRVFFAEQDKIRANNLEKGEQVIAALQALGTLEDALTINKQIQAVSAQYRQLKDLDRNARNSLHKRYINALKPLQQKVDAFYDDNAQRKQALVKQANALLETTDLSTAVEQAKQLQLKWKGIGFAGKKQDGGLWQRFREANDKVFARLHEQQNTEKQAIKAQLSVINTQLQGISQDIYEAENMSSLGKMNERLSSVGDAVYALDREAQRGVKSKLSGIQNAYQDKLKSFEEAKEHEQMQAIFDALIAYTSDELPAQVGELPSAFKQAFAQLQSSPEVLLSYSRKDTALAVDILFADSKLFADSEAKKAVQLSLMAAKLQGHTMPTKEQAFQHWIAQGKLSKTDISDLNRIQTLFVQA